MNKVLIFVIGIIVGGIINNIMTREYQAYCERVTNAFNNTTEKEESQKTEES